MTEPTLPHPVSPAGDDTPHQAAGPNAAAERALAEAEARRTALSKAPSSEIMGRGGLEPVRYGDWEVKGLASDF